MQTKFKRIDWAVPKPFHRFVALASFAASEPVLSALSAMSPLALQR